MESQSKLYYLVFRRHSNRKYFHAHLYKFKFFLDRWTNSCIVVFCFWKYGVDRRSRRAFASRNPGERFVFIQKRKRCQGRKVGTLSFHLKDKRAVRDRWILLQKKYKAKMHHEETASGISVDDMSEIDVLT